MSKEIILDVAPEFDMATEYSFVWNKDLLEKIDNSKPLIKLLKQDAIRNKTLKELPNAKIFIFFDHGNENSLIGNDSKILISTKDSKQFYNKKIYTMACLSAKKLGAEAFRNGCLEYWGAIESIGFTTEDAHLFGEVFIEGAYKRFIEEKDIDFVLKFMKDHFEEQKSKTSNPWTKIWLQKDADMWICWYEGNPPPEPEPKSWWEKFLDWLKSIIGFDRSGFITL